jgi:GDPmannose 4,6-dehydratase
MTKTAFITGVAGQDGSYLAELLLGKGYRVFGLTMSCGEDCSRIEPIKDRVELIKGDLTDPESLNAAVKRAAPDEVYNLAAIASVSASFSQPLLVADVVGLGPIRLMEAVRNHAHGARFMQASSSEMFGETRVTPQNELTPLQPRSPYGVAKTHAHLMVRHYRVSGGIFAGSCILYNHESPRRSPEYVTRKISLGVARIALGLQKEIELGNLDGRRDWGYAPEYVEAMWRTLQQKDPDDFVIATGVTHTVREFLEEACNVAGIEDPKSIVKVNKSNFRPTDPTALVGDASKAKKTLGWSPKTSFKQLVRTMVESDMNSEKK